MAMALKIWSWPAIAPIRWRTRRKIISRWSIPTTQFYGYGNTKITTQFASEDPATRGLVLLVIHGAGAEAWRAATPKAKFVIINLPFKQIAVKKLAVKKKTVMAIYAEETGGDRMTSATFWDGKKYRYQPIGSGMEQ